MVHDAVTPQDGLSEDACIMGLYRQRIRRPGRIGLRIGPVADEQEG
jgi:hypothetical protein